MICLLGMYTNKVLRAAICLPDKFSGLRSLRRKVSEGVRGVGGRWSAAQERGPRTSVPPPNRIRTLAVGGSAAPVSCSLNSVNFLVPSFHSQVLEGAAFEGGTLVWLQHRYPPGRLHRCAKRCDAGYFRAAPMKTTYLNSISLMCFPG